jgi:DNA-binding beta-propeller fold protein YncE
MKQINVALLSACFMLARCGTKAQDLDEPPSQPGVPLQAETQTRDKSDNAHSGTLHMVQTIPLPGVEGRFDHFAVELQRQHLFVAALGNDTLEVLDLRAGKHLHSIKGVQKPTGVAFVPEFNRIFAASGDGATCEIFNADTFRPVQSVKSLPDADNVRYDGATKQIYVGYGDGALGILEAATGKRLSDITLAGHPESFQLEKTGTRIFVNVPTAEHIAVVDRTQRTVVSTWPLDGARSNFPMALDEANHRLFIGCRNPARLLVYDTATGRVTATLEIGGDTDDLFYDAVQKRLYVACGAGLINVFQQKDADRYHAIDSISTAAGARTALFVPELKRFYLAVPRRDTQGAHIRVYAVQP